MKLVVHRSEPGFENVGINLRRRQVRVAEQRLDHSEVGPPLEQMSRKGVPHHVRAQLLSQPGLPTVFLDDLPEADPAQ